MDHQTPTAAYTPKASSIEQYELLDQDPGHNLDDEAIQNDDNTSSKAQVVTALTAPINITKPTVADVDNERFGPFKLVADAFATLTPLALLGLMIAIKRLDGKEVDRAAFTAWQDAINVVSGN